MFFPREPLINYMLSLRDLKRLAQGMYRSEWPHPLQET